MIGRVYDAAGGDAPWSEVALALTRALGTDGLDLIVRDERTMELELDVQRRLDLVGTTPDEAVATYARDFVFRDPMAREAYRWPLGSTWLQHELVDIDIWSRSAVYNEWMRPNGLAWIAGSRSELSEGLSLSLATYRGSEPIRGEERTRIDAIRSHVARAVTLQLRLEGVRRSEKVAWAMLDRFEDAAFALSRDGQVLYANAAAERLRERGWVGKSAPGRGPAAERGTLRHRVETTDLLWVFHRVPPRLGRTGAAALAFVSSATARHPSDAILARAFALTPAESRLVRGLLAGSSLQRIASDAGVAITTCRSQLKVAFQKTGTCRQAELVAKLNSVLPKVVDGGDVV